MVDREAADREGKDESHYEENEMRDGREVNLGLQGQCVSEVSHYEGLR